MALLELLFFPLILLPVLAITVPLTGVLVRFRASYNPKGLALDADGAAQPFTGPVVNSYFAMMRRVYRIEGVPGLYKGLMPTLVTSTLVFVFVFFALGVTGVSNTHGYDAPQTGVIGTFVYSVFYALLGLPALVITYRAIITPYRLPAFNPILGLRVLLTPTERRRPWIIYFTPGLLPAQILHIAYVVLILHTLLRVAGMGDFYKPARGERPESIAWWQATLWLVVSLASTVILTPLEVISTRLAIQRNHASAEYNSVSQEVDGDEEYTEYYGDSEDVIGLRADSDPYVGLVDCGRRIIEEEGLRALYRGWWITLLGGLAKA